MAEMTVEKAVEWLTSDKAFGQECYSRKQIAALIEQQAVEIERLNTEAQNKRMRELLVEIQSYSETYLDLDSRMKHIIDCAKAALEEKP